MAEINVQDMTCGHCVSVITRAIQSVAPAAKVRIDLPSRTVSVEGEISEAEAKKAIAEAGYTPS
ncbi:MAG: heavy-metal-associated domain-containing protein [Alphaproteobacteria bacterium]